MIENITDDGITLAMILRSNYSMQGSKFFTPNTYAQQLGYMHYPVGHKIDAHEHNQVLRQIEISLEVLVIRKGRLRVDFYNNAHEYLESRELCNGDIILLVSGGHGFEVLDEVEMVEIKQGPYFEKNDKTRFNAVDPKKIIIKKKP